MRTCSVVCACDAFDARIFGESEEVFISDTKEKALYQANVMKAVAGMRMPAQPASQVLSNGGVPTVIIDPPAERCLDKQHVRIFWVLKASQGNSLSHYVVMLLNLEIGC